MEKLSFIASDNRQYNISRVLSLIKSDVVALIKGANNIVIKPSVMVGDLAIASTHADALEALLAFISPYASKQIILAEGSAKGNTLDAFRNYEFFKIQDRYDFAIVDLNQDEMADLEIDSSHSIKISQTILNADLIISICPPRSDNVLKYSGVVKNIFEGSLARKPMALKNKITSGFKKNHWSLDTTFNSNILSESAPLLSQKFPKVLSILDGYTTLHSLGNIYDGKIASTHWAIASTNPIFSDYLACLILQIDITKISYLFSLLPDDINDQIVLGDDWHKHQLKINLPDYPSNL